MAAYSTIRNADALSAMNRPICSTDRRKGFRENQRRVLVPDVEKGCGRAEASRRRLGRGQLALAVSRELQAGPNICAREIREIIENLVLGHAGSEVFEHIVDRDPKPSNAGLPATFSGFDGDDRLFAHGPN